MIKQPNGIDQNEEQWKNSTAEAIRLQRSSKAAERHARFSEAQVKQAKIRKIKPPLPFEETSWRNWAEQFVKELRGDAIWIDLLVEQGREEAASLANEIEIAWKKKMALEEQKIKEQKKEIQRRIKPFQEARNAADKAIKKANADFLAAQHDFEQASRRQEELKEQVASLAAALSELEKTGKKEKSSKTGDLKTTWKSFCEAWSELEQMLQSEKVSHREKVLEQAHEALEHAKSAFLPLQKNYLTTKEVLVRHLERSFDHLKMDQEAWGGNHYFQYWSTFQLPEEGHVERDEEVIPSSQAIEPPAMLEESMEELRKKEKSPAMVLLAQMSISRDRLKQIYEGKNFKTELPPPVAPIVSTAAAPPTVEALVASIIIPTQHDYNRWKAREEVDRLIALKNDLFLEEKQRSGSIWSDVGGWGLDVAHSSRASSQRHVTRRDSTESFASAVSSHSKSSTTSFLSALSGRRSIASVTSNAEHKHLTKQLIKAEQEWAKQAREADQRRVAVGGVPYPEDINEIPSDKVRLEQWRQADQAALAFQDQRNRKQQEATLGVLFNEEAWNRAAQRRKLRAEADLLIEKLQKAEQKVKTLSDTQESLNDTWVASYHAAEAIAATLRRELTTVERAWLEQAEEEESVKEADDVKAAREKLKEQDRTLNQRWLDIKSLTPEERPLQRLEACLPIDEKSVDCFEGNEQQLHHIEQVWLYRLEADEELARAKREEAAQRYLAGDPSAWEKLSDAEREQYNAQIREKNIARQLLFQEELEKARQKVKETREAAKRVFMVSSKQAALKTAQAAEEALYLLIEKMPEKEKLFQLGKLREQSPQLEKLTPEEIKEYFFNADSLADQKKALAEQKEELIKKVLLWCEIGCEEWCSWGRGSNSHYLSTRGNKGMELVIRSYTLLAEFSDTLNTAWHEIRQDKQDILSRLNNLITKRVPMIREIQQLKKKLKEELREIEFKLDWLDSSYEQKAAYAREMLRLTQQSYDWWNSSYGGLKQEIIAESFQQAALCFALTGFKNFCDEDRWLKGARQFEDIASRYIQAQEAKHAGQLEQMEKIMEEISKLRIEARWLTGRYNGLATRYIYWD